MPSKPATSERLWNELVVGIVPANAFDNPCTGIFTIGYKGFHLSMSTAIPWFAVCLSTQVLAIPEPVAMRLGDFRYEKS
jgi:hypothetical protein